MRRAALELRFHALRHRKFDPGQPRVPAGHEDGGQWTGGGGSGSNPRRADGPSSRPRQMKPAEEHKPAAEWRLVRSEKLADGERSLYAASDGARILSERRRGAISGRESSRHIVAMPDGSSLGVETGFDGVQRIYDEDGALVSASRWGRYGPEPVAVDEPASHLTTAPPAGLGQAAMRAAQHLQAAIALHGQMAQALVQGSPVLSIRAEEYRGDQAIGLELIHIGAASEEQIDEACERHREVQQFATDFTKELRPLYPGKPRELGTAVHLAIKREVNDQDLPNYKSEASMIKAAEEFRTDEIARYGMAGTLRVDVYELLADITVCVYDIKTGKSVLSPARIKEIAEATYRHFKNVERFLIIEVKPD
jgi:hypothetical protein